MGLGKLKHDRRDEADGDKKMSRKEAALVRIKLLKSTIEQFKEKRDGLSDEAEALAYDLMVRVLSKQLRTEVLVKSRIREKAKVGAKK